MPRLRTVAAAAGVALLTRRALRRRIARSPLWPLPALPVPTSGRPRDRALTLTLAGREEIAEGVVQLRLHGQDLPPWEPGAHLELTLPSGLVRQYSLCGDPADRTAYTLATRLVEDGRGGSREVHEELRPGMRLRVRGPRNRFPLKPSSAYVFVAGGIGITPILPMLRAAEASGADWRILYCGRSRASMPYLDEVEKAAGPDRLTVVAEDESGRPDLAALLAEVPRAAAVYCCGPAPLMDAVAEVLPAGCTLHRERFTAAAAVEGDEPFEVELRRSGRTVTVAADESVLTAVRRELPATAYSCEQGFCGTCQQRVLAGEIEHRDELLTDVEREGSMLICVSRARGGRLVLDL
ncbi:PDR/VanB family oxidoreductase [Streptomyces indicus]|uniref:Ferredoxin-NADP reductase n=1 Tax=Streptomyces indicus TaxID=417292 RepID=A0A1G8YN93_9ACTN|nr:PDR/VanB family oxidoreductase [Streptomyces indicus]SDK04197.1 Ferredoxin-NADP reductase [Streptomyces indicus]